MTFKISRHLEIAFIHQKALICSFENIATYILGAFQPNIFQEICVLKRHFSFV